MNKHSDQTQCADLSITVQQNFGLKIFLVYVNKFTGYLQIC